MDSSSSEDDFVALSLIEKRRKRKYCVCVHPILKLRREEGEFLIKELRIYPERFKIYLRMSVGQFDALLAILEPHIKNKTTNFREPIDSEQRLSVCLRYGHTRTRPGGSAGQTEQLYTNLQPGYILYPNNTLVIELPS